MCCRLCIVHGLVFTPCCGSAVIVIHPACAAVQHVVLLGLVCITWHCVNVAVDWLRFESTTKQVEGGSLAQRLGRWIYDQTVVSSRLRVPVESLSSRYCSVLGTVSVYN